MGKKKRKSKGRVENKAIKGKGRAKKRPVIPIAVVTAVALAVAVFFLFGRAPSGRQATAGVPDVSKLSVEELRGGETRPTLSPSLFVGKTAGAYSIAKANPELLDAMYCYCYCSSMGHKSLLSCFVDQHAANCGICQDQAYYANALAKKGYDLAQARQAVDKKFWRPLR